MCYLPAFLLIYLYQLFPKALADILVVLDMNAKRIEDAQKLVKKGEEHLKTGIFKWSPDIDSAIECFDKGLCLF